MIKHLSSVALIGLAFVSSSTAQVPVRYFERVVPGTMQRIALVVDGESVSGTQSDGSDDPDTDFAYGKITGNVGKDGRLHVTYNYEVEGDQQSEEQFLKLDGNKLYIADGELEEHGPGQMVLKNPKSVKFEKALTEIPFKEVDQDAAEGKAVTKVLQEPLAKKVGAEVTFNGSIRIARGWARYLGVVEVAKGKKAKDEEAVKKIEGQLLHAYLKQDDKGDWKVVRFGFENSDGIPDFPEGQDLESNAPWPLDDDLME